MTCHGYKIKLDYLKKKQNKKFNNEIRTIGNYDQKEKNEKHKNKNPSSEQSNEDEFSFLYFSFFHSFFVKVMKMGLKVRFENIVSTCKRRCS